MKPGFWKKYILTVILVLGLCGLSVQGFAAQEEILGAIVEEGEPELNAEEYFGEELLPEAGAEDTQEPQDTQDSQEYISEETAEEFLTGDEPEEDSSSYAGETFVTEEEWIPASSEDGTADSEEEDDAESDLVQESEWSEVDVSVDEEPEYEDGTDVILEDGELLVGADESGDKVPIKIQVKNLLKGSRTTAPTCVFGLETGTKNADGEYAYKSVMKTVDGESVPSTLTLSANKQGRWSLSVTNKKDEKNHYYQFRVTLLEVRDIGVDTTYTPESFTVRVVYTGHADGSYEIRHSINGGTETEGDPTVSFTGTYSVTAGFGLASEENQELGLTGGMLAIKDSAGKIVEAWRTTETVWHTVTLTKDGSYTLTEIVTPEGFGQAEDIFFTLTDGVIKRGDTTVTEILMVNTPQTHRTVSFVVDNLVSGSPTTPAAFTFSLQQLKITSAGTYTYVPVYSLVDSKAIAVRGTIYGSGREVVFTVDAELGEPGDTAEYYVRGATEAMPGYSCDNSRHKVVFTLMKSDDGDEYISAQVDDQEVTSGDPVLTFRNSYAVTARLGLADSSKLTEGLSGGKLVLKDSAGDTLASWTTAKELWHSETLTKDGTYTLTETTIPDGFTKAADFVFTLKDGAISYDGKTSSDILLTCKALSGSWSFIDTEAGTTRAVKGSVFELYKIKAEQGSSAWKTAVANLQKKKINWSELASAGKVTSDGKGKASFANLTAGTCYVILQKSAPDTFQLTPKANSIIIETKGSAGKFSVSILSNGSGTLKDVAGTLRYLQYPTRIKITSVMGAKLKLVDKKTGKTVKKWTVDCNPTELKGVLSIGHTYKLSMTKVPAGYKKPANQTFTVKAGKPNLVQSVKYTAKKK